MDESDLKVLSAQADDVHDAGAILRDGGLVAIPTETVYGLAGDARNDRAVAQIFAAKGRPSFNPLIVHVPDLAAAEAFAHLYDLARAAAQAFWPGPLTMVVPLRDGSGLSKLVTAGGDSVALRIPAHPVARAVLAAFGGAVAAPSANPSGRISPTTARHVIDGLGGVIEAVVDGGPCNVGVESTIVDLRTDTPVVLRAGGVTADALQDVLGVEVGAAKSGGPIVAPGQLSSHYAPNGTVRLNASVAEPGETLLGFGDVVGDLTLSATGDLAEAAANLFDCLHQLDAMGATRIAVAPIPDHGLGIAINDRLRRAAAPR